MLKNINKNKGGVQDKRWEMKRELRPTQEAEGWASFRLTELQQVLIPQQACHTFCDPGFESKAGHVRGPSQTPLGPLQAKKKTTNT